MKNILLAILTLGSCIMYSCSGEQVKEHEEYPNVVPAEGDTTGEKATYPTKNFDTNRVGQ